jgi:hypothetical protein
MNLKVLREQEISNETLMMSELKISEEIQIRNEQ